MMFQIDWEDNLKQASHNEVRNKSRNRSLAIATLIGLQMATLSIFPRAIFAESQSRQSSPEEDTPEEVLRAEIYTDARSPIDGKQLTAAEYTELMEKLRSLDNIPPEDLVSPKVREVIDLLKLRKFLRQFIPFIP